MMEPIGEPRSVNPRIGEWMSTAFNLFTQAWQVWVIHGVLALLVPVVVGGGVAFASFALGFVAAANMQGDAQAVLAVVAATTATLIATVAPFLYLGAGMIHTAARQLRGETVTVQDIFVPFDRVMRLCGAFLIIAVLQTLGLFLCVVPAFIVSGLFLYAPPLIVDRGLGVGEALSTSVRMTRPYLLLNILWSVLIGLIYQAGGFVGVGYVATLPISVLMLMVGYWDAVNPPRPEPEPYNPLYRQEPPAP